MNAIIIRCKDCGALFYATTRLEPEDLDDFVEYVREGHKVSVADAEVVRTEFCACNCKRAGAD